MIESMQRKHGLLTLASVIFLISGLHPLPWPWIAWFGFIPLFMLCWDDQCRTRHLVLYVLLAGLIYYGIGLYWLLYFDKGIYFLAAAVTAPSFMIYFLGLRFFTIRRSIFIKMSAAVLGWALLYKIYAVSPISTIALEVPFYAPLPFFQIAAKTGLITLTVLIVGLDAGLALFIRRRSRSAAAGIIFFTLGLAALFAWGKKELKTTYAAPEHWAIIQHNLPVSGQWRLDHPIYVRSKYRELALKAAAGHPSLIIFPLYSFPDDALRNPEFFTGLAKETNTWILVATYIPKVAGQNITRGFFDSALLYSPEGKLADDYQAVKAPPFRHVSEYNGETYKILSTPFGKLGILLCYEDSTPGMAKKAVKNGAEILIALSNPGHFSHTWMPYYHFTQDRLRALETGRFVVRASPNGYSGVIDPKGRVLQQSELNREEILQIQVGR